MNEVWDLTPIYTSFEDPAFADDLREMKDLVAGLSDFTGRLGEFAPIDGIRLGIDLEEKITTLAGKLVLYASLRQATNTKDPEAASKMGQLMAVLSATAAPQAAFRSWAAQIPDLMELVRGDEVLREYEFLFANMMDSSRYLLSGKCEEIMAKMSLSGGNAWAELQQYLTSTVPVTYQGQTTNLAAIRNMAYDPDPAVRKEAYETELACYERIADPVAFSLNSLKLETISDCKLRGYEDPLDRTLKQSQMKRQTLDAMLGAMDEYLPKFWKYLKAKGKALGHENGLPWYDLFAPMGESTTRYTIPEAKEYLVNLFSSFDSELADMVARAFDESWIDFYPREGKVGGAFCAAVESLGQSRVLTNYDGMLGDLVTLAHELGHAFHNQCVSGHRILNHDYSMPLAETASTFNECVVTAAAIARAQDDTERLALIEGELQRSTQVIVDIYSRFRFEHMVFEHRQEQFMHAPTLCAFMTEAQKLSYGDGLDPDVMHPYMWICKSHYYGPTYYNFPYAFGALFARGLYAQYEAEGAAFVPKYKKLLHTTPVATAEDVAKVADIDLTDKNFWRSALQTVADQIDLFCEIVEGK